MNFDGNSVQRVLNLIGSNFERVLTLLASVLGIVNFAISFGPLLPGTNPVPPQFPADNPMILMLTFILLEAALAHAFGYLMVNVRARGDGFPYILMIVFALISAWTSMFNIQWIFLGPPPVFPPLRQITMAGVSTLIKWESWYIMKFLLLVAAALWNAIYFIDVHTKRLRSRAEGARAWQVIWFIAATGIYLW